MTCLYYFVIELLNLSAFTYCVEYKHDDRSLIAINDKTLCIVYVRHVLGQLLQGLFFSLVLTTNLVCHFQMRGTIGGGSRQGY